MAQHILRPLVYQTLYICVFCFCKFRPGDKRTDGFAYPDIAWNRTEAAAMFAYPAMWPRCGLISVEKLVSPYPFQGGLRTESKLAANVNVGMMTSYTFQRVLG
jgi:hypothetical protein